MPVTAIRDSDHLANELLTAAGKLSVLDFTATWCGPCKHIAPEFERLSDKFTTTKFFKIDVDECSDVAQKYDVKSMPTFIFIKNSQEITRFSGGNPKLLEDTIVKHGSVVDSFSGTGYSLTGDSSKTSSTASSDGIVGWLGSFVGGSGSNLANSNVENEKLNEEYETHAKEIFPLDKDIPVCKMQVRLHNGQKLTVQMNKNQSVENLRTYICIARPSYESQSFMLFTGHPSKPIQDESVTLEEANLSNAVVVLHLKK